MSKVHKDTAREAARLRAERQPPLEDKAAQKARSMGRIIQEKTHQAKDTVGDAVEYLKEHVPKVTVSHEEPTPEEKWQDELMEESMALAKEGKEKEEVTTPILCPPTSKGNKDEDNDANPYTPKTASEVKTTDHHHKDTVHEYRELPGHIHPLMVKEGVKKAVQLRMYLFLCLSCSSLTLYPYNHHTLLTPVSLYLYLYTTGRKHMKP